MTGLEKIVKAIEAEATANAEMIILQAKTEADDIMRAAKEEAEKKCAEITAKSDADAKEIIHRAESAAQLLEKKAVLDAKQQIINNTIIDAKAALSNLPNDKYIEVILRMVKKYSHNKQGQILFSNADRKRFPRNFEALLQKNLADKAGASLICSDETADIDGGFILKYGDIEENCSFEAIFSAAKDELQDRINSILFQASADIKEKKPLNNK